MLSSERAELRRLLQWAATQCHGKNRFDTKHAARHAVKHMRGKRINVYRCAFCHGWHIGGAAPKGSVLRRTIPQEADA